VCGAISSSAQLYAVLRAHSTLHSYFCQFEEYRMSEMTEHTPLHGIACRQLKGVGPKLGQQLSDISIDSILDLLFHLPLRYEDRTKIESISALLPGRRYVIVGEIEAVQLIRYRRGQLACRVSDGSGSILLRFFHFTATQQNGLQVGQRLLCFGEARATRQGLEMAHPEYRHLAEEEEVKLGKTLTPIYPTVKGLSQRTWMNLSTQALGFLEKASELTELFPEKLLQQYKLPSLQEALAYIHRPPQGASLEQLLACEHLTQKKLILEELLAHRLALLKRRASTKRLSGFALDYHAEVHHQFLSHLPFELTGAQKKVVSVIFKDISQPHPMLRLVQGDVGSGKTVVAALAMLQAVINGGQAALMAPTELLAEQHYQVLSAWFEPLSIACTFLSGSLRAAPRREALADIQSGKSQIIVGTHALFQKEVEFSELALVVIDEQHRFGVHQRLSLKDKGKKNERTPHQLIMTATPIPRTLAMSVYADLDCSVIDELPPGRKPVETVAMSNAKRADIVQRIRHVCEQGQQIYWVCPLIEESEVLQCQAAAESATQLQEQLPGLKVGLVHGRMKADEKEAIMGDFKQGEIQLLVATTVIEVGVDVPNATLMVIENAERLGLSQLHQLRGRVGRGAEKSYCVLLYQLPLSEAAKMRIDIMRKTNDGFRIAEEDLALRGPGDVLGTRQTGMVSMKIANIVRDKHYLNEVRDIADNIMQSHAALIEPLIDRWLKDREKFGEA
jgi:ATP-dependent DNA helicase RecG